jgi:hypothetical protein
MSRFRNPFLVLKERQELEKAGEDSEVAKAVMHAAGPAGDGMTRVPCFPTNAGSTKQS